MAVIPTEEQLTELSTRGQSIYDAKKQWLEPEFTNQFVAIHVDTGDYAIGKSSSLATRSLYQDRPLNGRAYVRKSGTEPEYGLAARLLIGEMMTGRLK